MKAVRENPDQFPNAVEDFSALSGLPRERVEDILSNPYGNGGTFSGVVVGPTMKTVMFPDVRAGIAEGIGTAAEKLGFEGAGKAIKDYGQSINPEFASERDMGDVLPETFGQAAPAIGAGIASGGVLPAAVAGAGMTALTFDDEDNVANMANDYLDGAVPDFLVVNPEDDEGISTAKVVASNLIVDLATAGLFHSIAKVYRVMKEVPDGFVDMNTLKALGEENGVPLRTEPGANSTAQQVLTDTARKATDEVPPEVDVVKVRKAAAKDQIIADAASKELGRPIEGGKVPLPVPQDVAQAWHRGVFGSVSRLINRSKEVNVGRRQGLKGLAEGKPAQALVDHAGAILQAVQGRNVDEVIKLIRSAPTTGNPNVDFVYKNAILKASMERLDDRWQAIVDRIREDPSLTTKKAWKEMAAQYHADKVKLGELYREAGSSASYAFLTRKGVKFSDDELVAVQDAEDALYKELKEKGYNLFSSKTEFVTSKILSLEEMGVDTLSTMDELYKMFDEFDAIRQGAMDNIQKRGAFGSAMSKAEREKLEGSFMRMVQDLHVSALLGQPSTAFLEAGTNFINNLTLPFTEHVLGRGNLFRAAREYAGYAAAWGRGWQTFKKAYRLGTELDHFGITEGAHSRLLDYSKFAEKGQWGRYVMLRLWKFAGDVAIASSESHKAWRAMGVAYADGLELAKKAGMTRPNAKKWAVEYANSKFDELGRIKDPALRLDVQQTSWQGVMDTRYATGRMAQAVDDLRNAKNPAVSMLARATVPFWRTLINIGSHSLQTTVPPGLAEMLWVAGKTKLGRKYIPTKALADFTGSNGQAAMRRAFGRSRMGYALMGAAWGLMETGQIDITGPAGYQAWDAKQGQMQTHPPSSLIIGDTAIDLTRLLPFSANLLLLGVMKDMKREAALEMQDGNYVGPSDSAFNLSLYGTALGMVNMAMMSDAASFQGVGNLFDAVQKAVSEQDPRAIVTFAEGFGKQLIPGLPRVYGKNQGYFTGDWTQDQAEGFVNEALASAGFHTGYTRLDFLGHPVIDKGRGIDPLNMKEDKTEDAAYAEFANLAKYGDLGLSLDRPDAVFDAASWKALGVQPSFTDWLFREEAPSLTQMKTKDGGNAWQRYRDLIYKGHFSKDAEASTTTGDGVNIGKVIVRKGETFEQAIRRTLDTEGYHNATIEGRVKMWKAIFGLFKKNAKDHLKANLLVDPSIFKDSRYGSPSSQTETFADMEKGAKALAANTQRTGGGRTLDEIFAIK